MTADEIMYRGFMPEIYRQSVSLGDSPSFILLCYRQNAGFVHKSVDVGTKYVHENVANKVKFAHKSVDASCGVR